MEWVALIFALAAFILFILASRGVVGADARTATWHYGWLGAACLTIALTIWHVVAPLEPLIKNT